MISSGQLATTVIRHVVFHDVPQRGRDTEGGGPLLSDLETHLDASQRDHLKTKLVRALASTQAYPIQFESPTQSPVPVEVRRLTRSFRSDAFLAGSRTLANDLFDRHTRATSPGLLCMIDAAADGNPCVILMKLERERGAQLELSGTAGHRTFEMSVLNDLVLTDSTRLFKCAMFMRTGTGDDDFEALACDEQHNVYSSDDIAKFWMRFLGCMSVVEPRVATQRFYETAMTFISDVVTEPTVKSDVYDHLQSQLKSNQRMFAPQTFIQQFIPPQYQQPFRDHFAENHIPLAAFRKNIDDIETKLRRQKYHTARGGVITVPTEIADEIIEVRDEEILVRDRVSEVK